MFLHGGALASLGLGLLPLTAKAGERPGARAEVRRYVPLGRTGIQISDISFGGSRLNAGQEAVVLHAFERGINYFDTAESYAGGDSERTIGNALHGKRDKVYLTSKVEAGAADRQETLMATLEGSLRRLGTDYVDVYFNHAVNDVRRLQNPEWHEFTQRPSNRGKSARRACPATPAT
jgi:aryl-alcohol dehydrogenase-like predicted oxidoreductase